MANGCSVRGRKPVSQSNIKPQQLINYLLQHPPKCAAFESKLYGFYRVKILPENIFLLSFFVVAWSCLLHNTC